MSESAVVPVALFCSDVHLSDKPPICRSEEPDWFAVMDRVLRFISGQCIKHDVPLVIAGDIFHTPRVSPKLEQMVIRLRNEIESKNSGMRPWYAIPGQHDLPGHDYARVRESSFGVMEAAGVFHDLCVAEPRSIAEGFYFYGIPFGHDVPPEFVGDEKHTARRILVTHQMIYRGRAPFPGAPKEGNVRRVARKYSPFGIVVSGDNHDGFVEVVRHGQKQKQIVINCGSVMRRSVAEVDYVPRVFLLCSTGRGKTKFSVEEILIPTESDVFTAQEEIITPVEGVEYMDDLIDMLRSGQVELGLNFQHMLETMLRDEPKPVADAVWGAVEQSTEE